MPARCAAHPARPAVDACPVCGRPRCGVDATGPACAVCGGRTGAPEERPAGPRPGPAVLRGLLAGLVVAALGGAVDAEYVEAGALAYAVPAVVGVMVGAAVLRAARADGRGRLGAGLRALAVALALAATALGFHLEESQDLLGADALPVYAAAGLGALLWTQPPRRRPARAP